MLSALPEMRPDFAYSEVSDPPRHVVQMGRQELGRDTYLCARLECGHVAPVCRFRLGYEVVLCHACTVAAGREIHK